MARLNQAYPTTIEGKNWLKLLGVTFQENPFCWDLHFDNLISKANSWPYILRVCKFYSYSPDQLNKLFDSLIMSLFMYGIEVWGMASQKYLNRVDKFCRRASRYEYNMYSDFRISTLIEERDWKLFQKITTTAEDMLSPKRTRMLRKRGHDYQLPRTNTRTL